MYIFKLIHLDVVIVGGEDVEQNEVVLRADRPVPAYDRFSKAHGLAGDDEL